MRVAAVSTMLDEADICGASVSHLIGNGVGRIYVALSTATTDNTREILEQFAPVTILDDAEPYHYQPRWINALATQAREDGADWIIPFDADEFWYAQSGETIKDALAQLPESTAVCVAAPFQHYDWEWREPNHADLSKMAFRARPGVEVANGNHWVSGFDGEMNYECLAVREIMFRSLEHLHAKCEARTLRLDPDLPGGDGQHQKDLYAMTPEQREAEWVARKTRASVFDPIPFRGVR